MAQRRKKGKATKVENWNVTKTLDSNLLDLQGDGVLCGPSSQLKPEENKGRYLWVLVMD